MNSENRVLKLFEEVKNLPANELDIFSDLFWQFIQEKREGEKMFASLEADLEACRKEYGDAPKLSDEEIDRILKDIRQQNRPTSNEVSKQ